MRIRGVLFDFDGTLTKPGSLDFPSIKKAMGCPLDKPILEYMDTLNEEEKRKAGDILESMENRAAGNSIPNNGALNVLKWLKKKKIPFGLVTRNGAGPVHLALEAFRPIKPDDFEVIITRNDAPPKPSPEGLLLAAEKLAALPSQILFVGDYRFDVLAGIAAGMITALLFNGNPSTLLPNDPQPHYLLNRLGEIRSLIRW